MILLASQAQAHPHPKRSDFILAGYTLGGQVYANRKSCEKARDESQLRGTVVGAVTGAVIGGSVADDHKGLASGAGAVVGGVVGNKVSKGSREDCKPYYIRKK